MIIPGPRLRALLRAIESKRLRPIGRTELLDCYRTFLSIAIVKIALVEGLSESADQSALKRAARTFTDRLRPFGTVIASRKGSRS